MRIVKTKKFYGLFGLVLKGFLQFIILHFNAKLIFLGFVILYCLIKGGHPAMPEGCRPEDMAGCPRGAKTKESENRN